MHAHKLPFGPAGVVQAVLSCTRVRGWYSGYCLVAVDKDCSRMHGRGMFRFGCELQFAAAATVLHKGRVSECVMWHVC
jgi:hypothetical protein